MFLEYIIIFFLTMIIYHHYSHNPNSYKKIALFLKKESLLQSFFCVKTVSDKVIRHSLA